MTVNVEQLIQTHGYWILAVGVLLEGETIVILAGMAARLGYLRLSWVMMIAMLGSIATDQLFFYIGRERGKPFLNRRPRWKKKSGRVLELLARHRVAMTLGFRFLYGMRTITPFIIGMTPIGKLQFLILNMCSAAIWAVSFSLLGYGLGTAAESVLGKVKGAEAILAGLVVALVAVVWLAAKWRERRKEKECKRQSGQGGPT